MNIKEEIKRMREFAKEITSSPEKAREFLVNAGICNPDGTLHENYGGERCWRKDE